LVARVWRGERAAIARAISKVENREEGAEELLDQIGERRPRAFVLGVTGPPGTGKSTLVDRLITEYRTTGARVGVIAVDPTSRLTGGALLGDRVRMTRHTMDKGVFIRSMASRGWAGGLSGAVVEAIQVLDAAGMEVVIVETAGTGQADTDVAGIAHAVMVVTIPGLGDEIQALKAGLMEVGDVYVVNKADLPGADTMASTLLAMVRDMKGRSPPVLKASALRADGIDAVFEAVERIRKEVRSPRGRQVRLKSTGAMITELAKKKLLDRLDENAEATAPKLAERVEGRELSVGEAARLLAEE